MARLSELLSSGFEQIRLRPSLQHSWELSLAVCLSSFLLLGCRLLGSFQPDADPVRGLGTLLLINGLVLTAFWILKQLSLQYVHHPVHLACWGTLLWTGAFLTNLALMPLQSILTVLGALFSLLMVAGLLIDQFLEYCSRQDVPAMPLDPATPLENASLTANIHPTAPPVAVQKGSQASPNEQNLLQWLSRRHEADGSEIVEGMVRLELADGQMQRSAHIVFAPSLQGTPEMECEPLGDAEVETILGDVYPHGFRVDLRRLGSDRTAQTVEVGFQAICSNQNKSAA